MEGGLLFLSIKAHIALTFAWRKQLIGENWANNLCSILYKGLTRTWKRLPRNIYPIGTIDICAIFLSYLSLEVYSLLLFYVAKNMDYCM